MRTIHRYPVKPDASPQSLAVYAGAVPVHIGASREGLSIWVERPVGHGPDFDMPFMVVGTGWEIPDGWEYVGTECDGFVWHLYRLVQP